MKIKAGNMAVLSVGLASAIASAQQAAPREPAGSNLTFYGFLKADVENVRGGSAGSISRLSNNLSVLGIRGEEDLGGGMQAFFQIESNAPIDTGAGSFADRNTGVGLRGAFGEISAGQWETPYRFVSVYAIDPFTAGIFASNSILGNGFVRSVNAAATFSFDRRQANMLRYAMPSWRGFDASIAYSLPEEITATTTPWLLSGLVTYQDGPLYLAFGHERHKDYFGPGSLDTGNKIGAAYSFGPTRVRFAFERLRYEPTPATSVSRNAWQVAATHTMGNNVLRASFVKAQPSSGNAATVVGGIGRPGGDTGARQVSLGAGHNLSKRTELWGACTKLFNGKDAIYNLSANAYPGLVAGQDVAGCGVGITHKF